MQNFPMSKRIILASYGGLAISSRIHGYKLFRVLVNKLSEMTPIMS